MPSFSNRLNLFEQFVKHLIRYIGQSLKLSAKLVQGPILVTKLFMVKSDFNLLSVCYVLAQIMVVNSFMAHLYANKLQCSSKREVPSRGMDIFTAVDQI